jgi:hypothetical protein
MKKTKTLRNTFISVGVLFAVGRLLAAGGSDGVLNFGNMPLRLANITFDAPDTGTSSNEGTRPIPTPRPRPTPWPRL